MQKTISYNMGVCGDAEAVIADVIETTKGGDTLSDAQANLIRAAASAAADSDPNNRALGIKITIRFKKFTIIIEF